MLKLGVIGLNEGNGHPYSFSAIFNGYDEKALQEKCPFGLVKEYLPRHHRNQTFIEDAGVTHIWTQDKALSESVAEVAGIPNVVNHYTEFIGKVDGVLLARDDPQNHLEMARPFIEAGMPIYIDKALTGDLADLNELIKITGRDYPIMAGSSVRFHRDVERAARELNIKNVRTIHGVSRCTWIRYASHLLDGICLIFGTGIESVQNLGKKEGFDVVHLRYKDGPDVILQVIEDLSLPIQFTLFSNDRQGHYTVNFSDGPSYEEYFYSFVEMMRNFARLARTKEQPVPFSELVQISRIIIAGEISRKENNRKIYLDTLEV